MLSFDVEMKAFAAAASFAFGALVLAGNPRRPANQALAVFLFLIGANQAAETMRTVVEDETALDLALRRAATVFAALDPVALYYFASAYPERNALNRPLRVALVMAPGGALALYGGWALVDTQERIFEASLLAAALSLYTAIVYTVVLAWALRRLLDAPSPIWRTLFVAASVAALLPWLFMVYGAASASNVDSPGAWFGIPWETRALAGFALPLGAAALLLRSARRHPRYREVRRTILLGLGTGGVFVVGIQLIDAFAMIMPDMWGKPREILGHAWASLRWILFGLLMSSVVARHNLLDMGLAMRRRVARGTVALLFLAAALGLVILVRQVAGEDGAGLRPTEWALLLLVGLTSQGSRTLVDWVASKAYGVPRAGDAAAAADAYRAALQQAHEEGRAPATDPRLARLREELGLDARMAAVLERSVAGAAGRLAPGRTVAGRYRLLRLLGQGSVGKAFHARDELLRRDVVLKEVSHGAGDAAALDEARLAGSLNHPNVVTLHDAIPGEETSLLVFEHVAGGTLADRVDAQGPLPHAEGLRLLDGLLAGLEAVHQRGIVHRDVKPANVLLTPEGTPKLADFGIARLREARTLAAHAVPVAGTPQFMAPEQRRGEPATFATDVYALGLLARRCLAPGLPPAVEAVIERALADEPAARWRDAGEMRRALGGVPFRARDHSAA